MEILGLLLGVAICAMAWAINELVEHKKLIDKLQSEMINEITARMAGEKRKAVIAEAATSQPKPAGVKMRRWNENADYIEKVY